MPANESCPLNHDVLGKTMAQETCSVRSSEGKLILLATILASGASFFAASAVAVALPRIQMEFNTALSGIQWVVNANLLTLSALILIGGGLGDQYGRKRVFTIGIALFSLAAFASGFAPVISVLILLQALQGVGAALMVPQSLAIINDCFAEKERGRAIGLWAGLSGAIAALGPLAAGWLVDNFSWQWVFFMMTPLSLTALVIAAVFVPQIRPAGKHHLDWQGGAIIFLGLCGLAYGLIAGPEMGWSSPGTLLSLGGGVITILLFIYFESRQRQPLVQLKIFKNTLVSGANMVTLLLYFGLNGVFFFTVLNLQQAQGYSPTQSGLALLPPIILITFLTGPSGAVADKLGPRFQMILGPLTVSAGMALLAMSGTNADYLHNFLPGLALFGLGMATVIPPLTKCALSVQPDDSGSASGINNGVSRVAGLLAVAVLGAVMLTTFSSRLADSLTTPEMTAEQRTQILEQSEKLGGITVPETFGEAAKQEATAAIRDSFAYGFRWAMSICSGLAFTAAAVSVITIKNKTPET